MLERLQKIIARAGIASRRHAEELIRGGQVRVNGVVVTELGAKADPERDRVEAAGRVAERPAEPGYYLLHKPIHVVSTMSDPEGRATLRHVLRGLSGGVFPVGRLDYAASGLILLTTDGELADRILKNSARMPKVYWLKVAGRLTDDEMQQIGQKAHARLRRLRAPGAAASHSANPWYEAELTDARSDSLRQALFAIDHPVEKLKRVKLGPLELGDLAEGHYRSLEPHEVAQLRRMVEQASGQTKGAASAAAQTKGSAPVGQAKRTASSWQIKRTASAWQAKRAAGAGEMKTGAPAWQNKSGASAGQTKSAATPWQSKSAASTGQSRSASTPWQTKSATDAGERKHGGSPWQKKSGAPAWQSKSGASTGQTKSAAGAGQTRSASTPWQTKSATGAGQKKTGGSPWQKKSGTSVRQSKPGAPAWQKKSAAGTSERNTGASAWRPKGSARKAPPRGTRGPHGQGGHGREGHGGRDRHHGHDARNRRDADNRRPRHPAQ